MLSDNFTVREKYSITNRKYLNTVSWMPPSCTSLRDERYLPELTDTVKNKLNSIFTFRYLLSEDTIKDENNLFGISYNDDGVLAYHARVLFAYLNFHEPGKWKHLKELADIPLIESVKDNIDRMTSITDRNATYIMGVDYDTDGNEKMLYIYDRTYDLGEYEASDDLKQLNKYCSVNNRFAKGILGFDLHSERMKFIMELWYPFKISNVVARRNNGSDEDIDHVEINDTFTFQPTEQSVSEKHLHGLGQYGFINEDDVRWLFNNVIHFEKPYKFHMEFVLDDNLNIEDVIFVKRIYENFKKVSEDFDPNAVL